MHLITVIGWVSLDPLVSLHARAHL